MSDLKTPRETATRLRCSVKTLAMHVRSGALRYVIIGHGTKRPRRMFTEADINEFIECQTRREVPYPYTNRKARRSTTSTSNGDVVAFTALRSKRTGAKQKR